MTVTDEGTGATATTARLAPLYAATFVLAAANSVVFPLLAELQDRHHLPTSGLGLVSGAAFVTSLVAQLLLAPTADRGHARVLLVAGLLMTAAGNLWFAAGGSLTQFVAARALTGAAGGCFLPAARAVVATASPHRVAERLGRMASVEIAGFAAGPVVGGILADGFGLEAPFVVIAIAALAAVALIGTSPLPASRRAEHARGPLSALALLRHRGAAAAALCSVALLLPVGVYDSLWARYLEDRGASTVFIGTSLTMYCVPIVLLGSLGGRLADRFGPLRSAHRSLLVVAPITATYGLLHPPFAIAAIAFVEAIAQAVAVPGAQAAMANACPPEQVAAGQGLAGALGQAAAGAVALGAAPLYAHTSAAWVFGAAAALVALLGMLSVRLAPDEPASRARR